MSLLEILPVFNYGQPPLHIAPPVGWIGAQEYSPRLSFGLLLYLLRNQTTSFHDLLRPSCEGTLPIARRRGATPNPDLPFSLL
ncbi:Uncharacterized protein FWK35_00010291 [Aphis craccivora]|uniref:Uncharacterized protein n=1 Tax=Aphis craccivora TaxID=307492 RepID=A0A6G0YLE8_APHCR|nr:Uncharacterized protein FWK35_00010291 [Aphis craccivora]